ATLRPTGAGELVNISYYIGRDALVSVYLEDTNGQRYHLRDDALRHPNSDPYTLRLMAPCLPMMT
ncbi:MAG: hypothetical protein HC893_11030, partial [Chloroflexaceae bacterium]|nr:hypothetical protein [Chloroflexaceae bacterium]